MITGLALTAVPMFPEAVFEGQHGESAAFDQEPQNASAQERELVDEVGVLADRDNARRR
jgi:hypothetical protein